MENYKALAVRYLKMNKRRTVLTILGTALTVLLLYVLLNLLFSYMDHMKEDYISLYGDYEIILYTETADQIAKIQADPVVKTAYIGGYYNHNQKKSYENAMFIKGNSPYRIDKNYEYLTTTYGVNGEVDQFIAAFSFQGADSSLTYILIIFALLVAYIFAIFGVGVIRNSIQLSLFEQIKDYGNLRCIGASKNQLRAIIYIQGAIMESLGIVIGVVVGQLGMSLVSLFINLKLSMHFIPIVLILVAYLGDLYFAMEENCKLVTGMSPVSALKGEFRIRKEKLKARKKSIYGKIFGIEGDYAYKSLMRSPGKFYKSVAAMFLGITAMIVCFGSMKLFSQYIDDLQDMYGYYQHYYFYPMNPGDTIDEAQKNLPEDEKLKAFAEHEKITDVRLMYETNGILVDDMALFEHLTDEYKNSSVGAMYQSNKEEDENSSKIYQYIRSKVNIKGYNEKDYARCEEDLVAGTLDVSENGIVVVNGTKTMVEIMDSDEMTIYTTEMAEMQITNYQIGDTIDIFNMDKMNAMMEEAMKCMPQNEENKSSYRYHAIEKCKQELLQQGEYETYVIEGILEKDTNSENSDFSIILPLEKYFEMTGQDENCVVGMAYHIEGDITTQDYVDLSYYSEEKEYFSSSYLEMMQVFTSMKNGMFYVLAFMLFIATVNSVNIINTTASNIHLRRREFAQLRVIGVSKERLIKMVMLEGVITAIVANLLGIIIGNLFNYGVYWYMKMLWDVKYSIPWLGILLGLLLSVAVLCGSVYAPLISMKQSMAEDLAASGE